MADKTLLHMTGAEKRAIPEAESEMEIERALRAMGFREHDTSAMAAREREHLRADLKVAQRADAEHSTMA